MLQELLEEFDENATLIDGEFYIPHEYFAKVFTFFLTNKDEINENKELAQQLTDKIIAFFKYIEFKRDTSEAQFDPDKKTSKQALFDGQVDYNGIGVFEYQLQKDFNENLGYLGKNEYDHTCMHTGKGFSDPDFIVTKSFKIKCLDGFEMNLKEDLKIDAKTFLDEPRMYTAFDNNADGHMAHAYHNPNVKILAYCLKSGKYYFGRNDNTHPVEIESLGLKFERQFVRLGKTDDGILTVDYLL